MQENDSPGFFSERDNVLEDIQKRVLWLAMQMVHHANNVRPKSGELKVGGHQASSASLVTVMTALYFDFLKTGDRISIKPHASPVYHAIQYLLGNLDKEYLTTLRSFHGLQAYPSRSKDPDSVDFSTGAVGLGAVAPNFSALADQYTRNRSYSNSKQIRRYISLVGDAELDEGVVWEAIAEPSMESVSNILWVVDLNRQSLDRVIPGIRVNAWRGMFAANGWNVIEAKYGSLLESAFLEPNGEILKMTIDEMSNDIYQRLLRLQPAELRKWLPRSSNYKKDLEKFLEKWDDKQLQSLFRNLGGHDFIKLREAFTEVESKTGPHVVFAYTLKGWMLPSVGDPQNHSVLLTSEEMEQLREELQISSDSIWCGFHPDSEPGKLSFEKGKELISDSRVESTGSEIPVPESFPRNYSGKISTQQIFGLVLTQIRRESPELADRIVSVSPDVASSTNLGGWINKVGVWNNFPPSNLPGEEIKRALTWEESPYGQHIELGISENNLFMMLGQLGLQEEMNGELIFPIGTVYDPFVRRGLDAFSYSAYSGGKFIVIGTPSGITLAPEGGAHQSVVTPSIGVEMPEVAFYEPCFGKELEWIMMFALHEVKIRSRSSYLRLTSKRIDQSKFYLPSDTESRERLRLQVLGGAYMLLHRGKEITYMPGSNVVNIMACGAMVPEALEASQRLLKEGVMANVINITGPGPLYRRFQELSKATIETGYGLSTFMADVIPTADRSSPIVTVVDGHPHSLAWIGGALGTSVIPLGVTGFGQSGLPEDLYKEHNIDVEGIMAACFSAIEI